MFEWQTGKPALLCRYPFALKEAMTAMQAGDARWLNESGCFIAKGGLRVVLIDAAEAGPGSLNIWHGRVYGDDGSAGNFYFYNSSVETYAVYGPFRSHAEAEKETGLLIGKMLQSVPRARPDDIPHQITSGGASAFIVKVGPTIGTGASLFCTYARGRATEGHLVPPCRVVGKLPENRECCL
jgi:hypothetical protein